MKVLLADDHQLIREGLKRILADLVSVKNIDEASNGIDALKKAMVNTYAFIILDLSMPGMTGIEIVKKLKLEKPKLPIIILSIHPEKNYALRCLKAGAFGYLTKDKASEELKAAVHSILNGRKYITSTIAEDLADYVEIPEGKNPHELLSNREYQILLMIASGKRIADIAEELYLSSKTVSTYRSRILQKMQFRNNVDITSYVLDMNLLETEKS